jgi:general secretion pathway protein C
MTPSAQNFWFSRSVTFAIGAVAAASALFWVLKFSGVAKNMPVVSVDAQREVVADTIAVARAMGAADPQSASASANQAAASRFVLTGVLGHSGASGAALIAVDGNPPKPFAVGSRVTSEWSLRSVQARRAVLVSGFNELAIEMPALPPALITAAGGE